MSVIDVDGVTYSYVRGVPVVEDVSLSVDGGEFLGIVGPNGSGKSTLVDLMLGLESPDEGTVRLFGEPVERFSDGHRIGYVAQNIEAVTSMPITVREVVTMGRYAVAGLRRFTADDRAAVDEALTTVDIADLGGRRVSQLSGGQRQRVFLARALAGGAELLVLDEPAVGVDTGSREAFYALLRRLADEGRSIVLVEHDIGVVTNRADRIACMDCHLTYHGPAEEFLQTDALARAYGHNSHVLDHDHGH